MTILNRRYAVIGWLAWRVGKVIAKRKARAAVPVEPESKRGKAAAAAIAVGAAAVGGALFLWWKRSEDGSEPEPLT